MNDFFGVHKHHIVFRSQGGLDFPLNLIELTQEEHEGNNGPHQNREVDLALKRGLQEKLFWLFPAEESFTLADIATRLKRTERYFEPHFRKVPSDAGVYSGQEIVKRLMGGKFY